MTIKLVYPSIEYIETFIDALREGYIFGAVGIEPTSEKEIHEIERDFDGYLKRILNCSGEIIYGDGKYYEKVPTDTYWLVKEDYFIGAIALRHHLNEFLIHNGGHIGYGIRPSCRGQGYATKMLSLCLDKARDLNIKRVLLTCEESNLASAKVMVANGGVLENIVSYYWRKERGKRFWIDL